MPSPLITPVAGVQIGQVQMPQVQAALRIGPMDVSAGFKAADALQSKRIFEEQQYQFQQELALRLHDAKQRSFGNQLNQTVAAQRRGEGAAGDPLGLDPVYNYDAMLKERYNQHLLGAEQRIAEEFAQVDARGRINAGSVANNVDRIRTELNTVMTNDPEYRGAVLANRKWAERNAALKDAWDKGLTINEGAAIQRQQAWEMAKNDLTGELQPTDELAMYEDLIYDRQGAEVTASAALEDVTRTYELEDLVSSVAAGGPAGSDMYFTRKILQSPAVETAVAELTARLGQDRNIQKRLAHEGLSVEDYARTLVESRLDGERQKVIGLRGETGYVQEASARAQVAATNYRTAVGERQGDAQLAEQARQFDEELEFKKWLAQQPKNTGGRGGSGSSDDEDGANGIWRFKVGSSGANQDHDALDRDTYDLHPVVQPSRSDIIRAANWRNQVDKDSNKPLYPEYQLPPGVDSDAGMEIRLDAATGKYHTWMMYFPNGDTGNYENVQWRKMGEAEVKQDIRRRAEDQGINVDKFLYDHKVQELGPQIDLIDRSSWDYIPEVDGKMGTTDLSVLGQTQVLDKDPETEPFDMSGPLMPNVVRDALPAAPEGGAWVQREDEVFVVANLDELVAPVRSIPDSTPRASLPKPQEGMVWTTHEGEYVQAPKQKISQAPVVGTWPADTPESELPDLGDKAVWVRDGTEDSVFVPLRVDENGAPRLPSGYDLDGNVLIHREDANQRISGVTGRLRPVEPEVPIPAALRNAVDEAEARVKQLGLHRSRTQDLATTILGDPTMFPALNRLPDTLREEMITYGELRHSLAAMREAPDADPVAVESLTQEVRRMGAEVLGPNSEAIRRAALATAAPKAAMVQELDSHLERFQDPQDAKRAVIPVSRSTAMPGGGDVVVRKVPGTDASNPEYMITLYPNAPTVAPGEEPYLQVYQKPPTPQTIRVRGEAAKKEALLPLLEMDIAEGAARRAGQSVPDTRPDNTPIGGVQGLASLDVSSPNAGVPRSPLTGPASSTVAENLKNLKF